MHQLRLVFTCMCAYLPRKDDVLAVIPDGRPKRRGPNGNGHNGHDDPQAHAAHATGAPPHVAAIQFDPVDLSPRNRMEPHLVFRHGGSRREQGLYFLTGHDIALDPPPAGPPALRGGRGDKKQQEPTSAADAGDFSWVAEISKLDPDYGVMDPECTVPGTSANDRVVARMSLKGGSLSTAALGTDVDKKTTIVFPFREPGGAREHPQYKQALAVGVAYEVGIPTDEVTLTLTPFRGGAPEQLVFSFARRPMGDALEILVRNMPLDSLLDVGLDIEPRFLPEVDDHFLMFYSLSKTPGKQVWIPYSRQARPLGPVCPSAQFTE